MMRRTLLAAALALAIPAVAQAGDEKKPQSLTIGDKAPAIDIAHWLKGEQIDKFEDGKVYVVEFWATWCGPCVASMPHLSEMQEKYKDYDVTVIGVSDEPLPTVVDFLCKTNKQDGKMNNERTNYTLTTDPDKSVKDAYFTAAGQRGIPCAFIVGKDGHVEWLGHPMGMDAALDAVVRDTWDREAFKIKFEEMRASEKKAEEYMAAMQKAVMSEDWPAALAAADSLIALGDEFAQFKIQKFMLMATKMGDYERAFDYAAEVVDENWDDAMMLNQTAWLIVDEPSLEQRDLKLAMRAAKRANELTDSSDPAILDTLARVYYEQGELEKAVMYQRKAVKHAEGPMLEDLQKTLEKYENKAK